MLLEDGHVARNLLFSFNLWFSSISCLVFSFSSLFSFLSCSFWDCRWLTLCSRSSILHFFLSRADWAATLFFSFLLWSFSSAVKLVKRWRFFFVSWPMQFELFVAVIAKLLSESVRVELKFESSESSLKFSISSLAFFAFESIALKLYDLTAVLVSILESSLICFPSFKLIKIIFLRRGFLFSSYDDKLIFSFEK